MEYLIEGFLVSLKPTFVSYLFNKITILDPPRYKLIKATVNKICVTGSVDGVIIAAKIVEPTITYFQADSIAFPDKIPNKPNTT